MLRTLCSVFFTTAIAIGQQALEPDAAERCAAALLRGDTEAAARAATSASDPATRERLQAALLPPSARALAMLAVATRHADSPQADLAILAGAAAVLSLRDHGQPLPELQAWHDLESGYDDPEWSMPGSVVAGLWRQLARRRASGGALAGLAEAEQMLVQCSTSRFGFEPARVEPAATWTLPKRREELRLRAWRRQPGRGCWRELNDRGPAEREVLLPVTGRETMTGLPAGDWLVELASTTTPWRGMRAVEVSDLDVVALLDGPRIALAAWRNGESVDGGEWWLRGSDERPLPRGSFGGATAMLVDEHFDDDHSGNRGELFVQVQDQQARVPLAASRDYASSEDRWQLHLMVDRPVHRPGETIQGRLLLRRTRYEGSGVDAVAHAAVAAHQDLELRALEGTDEMRLRGRTDAHGVWAFQVPLPEHIAAGPTRLAVFLPDGSKPIHRVLPCSVAHFRRAALMVAVEGPTTVDAGEDATVALRTAWATGAPAAGLRVVAEVRVWPRGRGSSSEQHRLATDADGLATLQLPLQSLSASWVRITFEASTPSGPRTLTHTIAVRERRDSDAQASWRDHRTPALFAPATVVVGQPCTIRVLGRPGSEALFVVGRGRDSRTRTIRFDQEGECVLTLTPARDEWPAFDLAVASCEGHDRERVPMLLRAPAAPRVTLPAVARPGAEVGCRVATGVAGTAVTAAVVDERIFAIAADRTPEPGQALRPRVAAPAWRHATSARTMSASELLSSLLVDGRVPASGFRGSLDGSSGAAGGAGPAAPSRDELRDEFRATAAFVTAIADEDGVAELSFALPDDLTTWRVSLVGIAPDGMTFQERRELVTRLPLAAEPVLPRVLRAGDTVQVPITVDRQVEVTGDATVRLQATCADASATIENGDRQLETTRGAIATALVTLRGLAAGEAGIALSASLGELGDRSQRLVEVQPDAVSRPLSSAAMADGEVSLVAPEGMQPGHGIEVSVLGGSSAAWGEIERRLTAYPYGCVEQTLSRLLPFFAAVRGAEAHGTPPPAASEAFEQRLLAGLRRMRQLQRGRGGAFSFWPGGDVDPGMTALVLHGLAVMRDGGLDPARHGLACDVRREPFAGAIRRLLARDGRATKAAELLDAELAAACLRLEPTAAQARAAVIAVLDGDRPLPVGLLLRCGLALAAAGDTARAANGLQRCADGAGATAVEWDFPGENALAQRALQLELHCVLHPGDVPAELVTEVLLGCLDGYSTTYAKACALAALALALPHREAAEFTVRLRIGDVDRELVLSPDNDFTARLRTPYAPRCEVIGPAEQQLVLRMAGQRHEPGSDHAAWSSPIVVERTLCRRLTSATAKQRRRHEHMVSVGRAPLRVGEVVWLCLRVSAPHSMRYVVVDCPLPAGFEPAEDLPWIERFDDRIAISCSRIGPQPSHLHVPVVPTLIGSMVWPPTTAAPMYAGSRDGGTAGGVVRVVAAPIDPGRPSRAGCFAGSRTAAAALPSGAQSPLRALEDAFEDLRRAFDDGDAAALDAARSAVTAACVGLRRGIGEPDAVLEELNDTVRAWREDVSDDEPHGARSAARSEVLPELVSLQHDWVKRAIDALRQDRRGEYDDDFVETIADAVQTWPERATREELLAQVLELAQARDAVPRYVLDDHDGPVEDEHLRAVLMTMLAGRHAHHGERILRLLPRADLAGVSPSVLIEAAGDDWPPGLLRMLLDSPLGRAEVDRLMRDPEFVGGHAETLIAELPPSLWPELPLPVFAELDRCGSEGLPLAESVAASKVATADLQRELLRTEDLQWQGTLANALRQRGVDGLGPEAANGDRFVQAWRRALALRPDDATAALRLHEELRDELGADRLREFLRPIVLAGGSPEQLARIAGDLDERECAAMLQRLAPASQRTLLGIVTEPIARLPTARSTADCEALWAYAERLHDEYDALETLCRSDCGLAFAQRHIAAIPDEDRRDSLSWDLCTLRGLDPDTGRPPVDAPWLPLLHAVALQGRAPRTWSHADRQLYDRLRSLRGLR